MNIEKMLSELKTAGFPIALLSFPEGKAPPLPYLCWLPAGSSPLFADGCVYHSSDTVQLELYTDQVDPSAEDAVEASIAGYHYKKSREYLSTELCWMTTYEIEV